MLILLGVSPTFFAIPVVEIIILIGIVVAVLVLIFIVGFFVVVVLSTLFPPSQHAHTHTHGHTPTHTHTHTHTQGEERSSFVSFDEGRNGTTNGRRVSHTARTTVIDQREM